MTRSRKYLSVNTNRLKTWLILGLFVLTTLGCADSQKSDAYGQFEAIETTVSSEQSGKLMKFTVDEGDQLSSGQNVGLVDSATLAMQKDELESRLASTKAKINSVNAKVEVQKEELKLARSNLNRVEALKTDQAATDQLDEMAHVMFGGTTHEPAIRLSQRLVDLLRVLQGQKTRRGFGGGQGVRGADHRRGGLTRRGAGG